MAYSRLHNMITSTKTIISSKALRVQIGRRTSSSSCHGDQKQCTRCTLYTVHKMYTHNVYTQCIHTMYTHNVGSTRRVQCSAHQKTGISDRYHFTGSKQESGACGRHGKDVRRTPLYHSLFKISSLPRRLICPKTW